MLTIALFFGGLGNESEVSIMSARNVIKYFDYQRYRLILIYWCKTDRKFYLVKNLAERETKRRKKIAIENFSSLFDIALLMTHGRYGEDGVLQAILESQKIRYCGARVLSSALCMDKGLFKDLVAAQGWRQVKYAYVDFSRQNASEIKCFKDDIKKQFKWPVYVKPANSGSSVGIQRVENFNK
jgi:D-alanine-D-alanine ligase